MGLAASQGRLLLLTARKSDLEFRAQEISQRRLILATELESVASEYARASANRQMKLTTFVKMGQANQTAAVNLTYYNLYNHGCTSVQAKNEDGTPKTDSNGNPVYEYSAYSSYRVKNANGQVVIPSSDYAPTPESLGYSGLTAVKNEAGVITYADNDNLNNAKVVITIDNRNYGQYSVSGHIDDQELKTEYVIDPRLDDKSETENCFQEGLRNGKYIIEQFVNVDGNGNAIQGEWQPVGWSGMTEIQDNYYTEDDAYAQAKYQSASARVQAQDKKLETDQKQIETQHKAVETEFESVQKVITNNIESSFKMFS